MGEIRMTPAEHALAMASSADIDARKSLEISEQLRKEMCSRVEKLEKALLAVCTLILGEYDANLTEQFDTEQIIRAGDIQVLARLIRDTLLADVLSVEDSDDG